MPNSSWNIEDRLVGRVSAMSGGYSEIPVKNTATGEEITLVHANEPVNDYISFHASKKVIITFPSRDRGKIIIQHNMFGGIPVTYNFIP